MWYPSRTFVNQVVGKRLTTAKLCEFSRREVQSCRWKKCRVLLLYPLLYLSPFTYALNVAYTRPLLGCRIMVRAG